jgi:hypothetical protein
MIKLFNWYIINETNNPIIFISWNKKLPGKYEAGEYNKGGPAGYPSLEWCGNSWRLAITNPHRDDRKARELKKPLAVYFQKYGFNYTKARKMLIGKIFSNIWEGD